MSEAPPDRPAAAGPGPVSHTVAVPVWLLIVGIVALASVWRDSVTWDETGHLAAGISYVRTGDFRLASGHPPLANAICALPAALIDSRWPDLATFPAWRQGSHWFFGHRWLFEMGNDPQRLVLAGRGAMVVMLVLTLLLIYVAARRILGREGALLALFVAGLSPNLLANGSLVTTDLPLTLWVLLTLVTCAWMLERITPVRVLAAGVALGTMAVVKYSWPLILPALGLMTLVVLLRRAPLPWSFPGSPGGVRLLHRRPHRILALLGSWAAIAFTVWATIWSSFAWRFSPFPAGTDRGEAMMLAVPVKGRPEPRGMDDVWRNVLLDARGRPDPAPAMRLVGLARRIRLLPEAYLYGLAFTARTTGGRWSYFLGEVSSGGWPGYFPAAVALKTPIPTLALAILGLAALFRRGTLRSEGLVLGCGILGFAALYLTIAIVGRIDIGIRHVLPVYPALMLLAGASAGWIARPRLRWAGALLLFWLVLTNARVFPHYLAYFNELAGGPAHGDRYLVDSNLDWGQDLVRLADYVRARGPAEPIKLAYFGSADPQTYGIEAEMLAGSFPFGTPVRFTAGTYVASVTLLKGVYDATARASFWAREENRARYRQLATLGPPSPGMPDSLARLHRARDSLRAGLLLHRLDQRAPDERIGYSLRVYQLDASEIEKLLAPPPG